MLFSFFYYVGIVGGTVGVIEERNPDKGSKASS